jgi:hypothetical protein
MQTLQHPGAIKYDLKLYEEYVISSEKEYYWIQ